MKFLNYIIPTIILTLLSLMVRSSGLVKSNWFSSNNLDENSEIVFFSQQPLNQNNRLKPSLNFFFASEPLYATISISKPIASILHEGSLSKNSIIMYDLYINGNRVAHKNSVGLYRNIPEEKLSYFTQEVNTNNDLNNLTDWHLNLLPIEDQNNPLEENIKRAARSFALALLEQDIGKQHVQLNVYSRDVSTGKETKVLASGTFNINITTEDKKQLAFKYTAGLPEDHWSDIDKQKVLDDVTIAFEKKFAQKPLMVGLNGSHWHQGRYQLNAQIYRKLSSWAVFASDKNKGDLPITHMNWVSLYKQGKWTALKFDSECADCSHTHIEESAVHSYIKETTHQEQHRYDETFTNSNNQL